MAFRNARPFRYFNSSPEIIRPHDLVHSFVKNAGLGFVIPNLYIGERHEHLPDFIIRLAGNGERYLILETKGYDPLRGSRTQAAKRWVRAVNASGDFGSWDYVVVSEMGNVGSTVRQAAE